MIAVFVAAECGDAKKVDQLYTELTEDDDEPIDYKGRTALHFAVERGHDDVVEVLINHEKSDLLAKDSGGFTAMHVAAELGHDEIAARLLERRFDLATHKAYNGLTCLHLAAAKGHVSIVIRLLELADNGMRHIFDADKLGRSALDLAEAYGHAEVVTMLVEYMKSNFDGAKKMFIGAIEFGAEQGAIQLLAHHPGLFNIVDSKGRSALHRAASYGRRALVCQLLALRPDLTEVGGTYKENLLYFAIEYGYDTLVSKLLVEKPHLIDVTNYNGKSILLLAVEGGHDKVISQLLAARPELGTQRNSYGNTPLHNAIHYQRENVVAALLAHNPELIEAEDLDGLTPFELAVDGYNYDLRTNTVATCLLAHGATKVNVELFWSFLDVARDRKDDEIVSLMLTRKPELIRSNMEGFDDDTVLHRVFGRRRYFEGLYSEELMLKCWQMYPEALHQTNRDENNTPLHLAIRSDNKFAIELVQWKLPLDEIVESYAKCEKQCPQSIIDTLREPLLSLGGLNEDVVGVVCEYFVGEEGKPSPNNNKRKRLHDVPKQQQTKHIKKN